MKIVFTLLAVLVPEARAYVYFTQAQISSAYFPGETPDVVEWTPDETDRAWLKSTLGYNLPRAAYTLLVGDADVAVLDEQLGQHEPINVATLVDSAFKIRRVEVMVYREAYGEGVRADGFRGQFLGLGADNPMRVGKEIQIVSGATVSSRSLATAVRRACALVQAYSS